MSKETQAQKQKTLQVEQGYNISIEYTFTDKDNNLLGSSEHSGVYTFLAGFGDAIPGLEKNIEGATIGETRKFSIPPNEAYGETDTNLIHTLPRSSFPTDYQIVVGNTVSINNKQMTIITVEDNMITVDGNHPLAGKELFFTATITNITVPDEQEGCSCGSSCGCS